MNNVYKIVAFISVSIACAYTATVLESSFVDKFSENILALLTTLFAINIASSTLIAGKLREIQDKTGYEFNSTKKDLKSSFYEQIILILLAFIASLLRESKVFHDWLSKDTIHIACDAVIFYSFVSYIDIIRDIGSSLFDLLEFDNKKK